MIGQNPFTEEGRTRFRNFGRRLTGYLILSLIVGIGVGWCYFQYRTRASMTPLQKLYLRQYAFGSIKSAISARSLGKYRMLVCHLKDPVGGEMITSGVRDIHVQPVRDAEGRPVRTANGYVFAWNPLLKGAAPGKLIWESLAVNNRQMCALMRTNYYDGYGPIDLVMPSLIAGLTALSLALAGLVTWDHRYNKKYEQGRRIRGTKLIDPDKYRPGKVRPGLALPALRANESGLWGKLYRRVLSKEARVFWLPIPFEDETFHATILGDTGMGKSQIIHQFLRQIALRGGSETAIIYDPKGEFLERQFNPDRGDLIINPLDSRSPFWSPSSEIRLKTDYEMIAESFFPGSEQQRGTTSEFFTKAARSIFARLLEFNPNPRELVEWLTDEEQIDRRVAGTELAHLIGAKAPQQRGGVIGSLATVGKFLRLLPERGECTNELSLTAWAAERRGWLFITATKDVRDQLRPLLAVYLDLLMKRLMSVDERWARAHPCWLVVDEADSLGRLPALYGALVEGRSYGMKLVIGTQNKHQFDEKYGQKSATMLSAAALKIMLRCNEPDSARWVSELIGSAEWEKPRTGITASVSDHGRDSVNYMSQIETRSVVSREEIMGLQKLHGYWKYGDTVVPFKIKAVDWRGRHARFIPRESVLAGNTTSEGSEAANSGTEQEPKKGGQLGPETRQEDSSKMGLRNDRTPTITITDGSEPVPEDRPSSLNEDGQTQDVVTIEPDQPLGDLGI
jgi:hypothetical protein